MPSFTPRPPYSTIGDQPVRHEGEPVKGSRFIGEARHVADETAAGAAVAAVRAALPGATHHCWAYALRAGRAVRSSDDGEPGGSAGRPILAQITGRQLFDVVVIVTRYFGGTKLGVGGLVRAYGAAAGAVLDRAVVETVTPTRPLWIDYAYDDTTSVETALASLELETVKSTYTERVASLVRVPDLRWDQVRETLAQATRGRIRFGDPRPDGSGDER